MRYNENDTFSVFVLKNGDRMKKRKKVGLLTKIVVAVLSVYIAFNLVSLQIQISGKRQENTALQTEIDHWKNSNDKLRAIVDGDSNGDYIADAARNYLDYVTPGERVFVDISGN